MKSSDLEFPINHSESWHSKVSLEYTTWKGLLSQLNASWDEPFYDEFPVKTIHRVYHDDIVGVHLVRAGVDSFKKYFKWCEETFGEHGKGWQIASFAARTIYFPNEKFYTLFMLKWQ